LDWQYRQEQAESKFLDHAHMMHKPHKVTGGSHKKAQAQASAWGQPLANAVTLHAHAPQLQQQMQTHQLQSSDTMDVDRGGRHPLLKCYSCCYYCCKWFTWPNSTDNFLFLIFTWMPLFLLLPSPSTPLTCGALLSLLLSPLISYCPLPYIPPTG